MKINDMPREQIPWYPTIDRDKCTGCGSCVDFCSHGTYIIDEATGKAKVSHPYNCVVGCSGCEPQCPEEAISFPPLTVLAELASEKNDESRGCGCGCDCDSCG